MFLVIICFLLIVFTLSYFIWWLIYRKLFKSQKKISKFLVFIGAVGLIVFYYTPYSFYVEPSFWQFRRICKLNELPNDEYKYNKILGYFDVSLDTLDWEEVNKGKKWRVTNEYGYYKKGIYEYATLSKEKQLNSRVGMVAVFLSNESPINRYNINAMSISISWDTKRYFLEKESMTSYNYVWIERTLGCVDVAQKNMTPKGFKQ